VQIFKLDASFMGVPQKRERAFFVANRMGYPRLRLSFDQRPVLFGEMRSETSDVRPGRLSAERLARRLPTDRDISDITQRTEGRRVCFTMRIMRDDEVCDTIPASGSEYRACDGMCLSRHDIVTAQTFPQDYAFASDRARDVKYVCGMSVPPVMMANLATEIRRQWLDRGAEASDGRDQGRRP
jgi:DNA (cytosine-5)-methyltransferase 1